MISGQQALHHHPLRVNIYAAKCPSLHKDFIGHLVWDWIGSDWIGLEERMKLDEREVITTHRFPRSRWRSGSGGIQWDFQIAGIIINLDLLVGFDCLILSKLFDTVEFDNPDLWQLRMPSSC